MQSTVLLLLASPWILVLLLVVLPLLLLVLPAFIKLPGESRKKESHLDIFKLHGWQCVSTSGSSCVLKPSEFGYCIEESRVECFTCSSGFCWHVVAPRNKAANTIGD
jgi:hypothetical protein